jgi:N-acetylmuramoyl-L-alanine amidase
MSRRDGLSLLLAIAVALAGCTSEAVDPTPSPVAPSGAASVEPSAGDRVGAVEPAPGSDSEVYAPNPAAIVVAVDAGHGGCLDWGVPDPSQRGEAFAEKTMTLGIAAALRQRLEAEGVTVVMIRDGDEALAGDNYPDLGCNGPDWRDANGDGESGFNPEGAVRTRDELQARLDVANLTGADLLLSIHINAPFDNGQTIEIAFSETFYTDETAWGSTATARLAEHVQAGVVRELEAIAGYDRGDRGITAHNFYMVAPPLLEPTAERPDPRKQPTRGAFMPAVLTEVGSITLRAEQDLLVTEEGQAAVADGLFDAVSRFVGGRSLAARVELADAVRGHAPNPVAGSGPPFWAPVVTGDEVAVRITNTGTDAWPAASQLLAGWAPSDDPYLSAPPDELEPVDLELPALRGGESVVVTVTLDAPSVAGRHVAWLTVVVDGRTLADDGSPALQIATE